ncbi:MAG: hypothetical protein MJK04_36385 [Psychrosphaera sp.]|nr:hypothetical protein [Psychrosphaera sp.]
MKKVSMYLKVVSLIFVTSTILGCAPIPGVKPEHVNIAKSKAFDASYEQVWSAIIAGIAESNLSISTLEKDSGIISMSKVTYDSDWAYEGTRGSTLGQPDVITQRVADFNIFATKQAYEKTKVQVNSDFKMLVRTGNSSQAYPYNYQWEQAYSNGKLEQMILDGIEQRLNTK